MPGVALVPTSELTIEATGTWRTSRSRPLMRASAAFCVNVPAVGQRDLGSAFAGPGNRFRGVRWSPGRGGAPLLQGSCAWISCDLVHEYDGGDHTIVMVGPPGSGRMRREIPLSSTAGAIALWPVPTEPVAEDRPATHIDPRP